MVHRASAVAGSIAACLKVNGKVLREKDGTVYLPFGSEYSVFLKNLESVRMQVSVSIDGTEVSNGWLVLQPNSTLDLERFIKDGNLSSGNRFKFIERTTQIEDHRGVRVDDGLIRIEYKKELKTLTETIRIKKIYEYEPYYPYNPWKQSRITYTSGSGGPLRGCSAAGGLSGTSFSGGSGNFTNSVAPNVNCTVAAQNFQSANNAPTLDCSDSGITVPGSESHQGFYTVSDFDCGPSEVLILNLRGQVGAQPVSVPITVDRKPKCITCGLVNSSIHSFCGRCGTALELL